MQGRRRVVTIVGLVALALGSGLAVGAQRWASAVPFSAQIVQTEVSLTLAGGAIAGHLTLRGPTPPAGSSYALVAIDKRASVMLTGWSSSPDGDGSGWVGAWSEQLPQRYPWLESAAAIRLDDGSVTDPGMALVLPGRAALDETFSVGGGELVDAESQERTRVSPPQRVNDVLVALVLLSPDGDVWWARRIHG